MPAIRRTGEGGLAGGLFIWYSRTTVGGGDQAFAAAPFTSAGDSVKIMVYYFLKETITAGLGKEIEAAP